MQHREWLWLLIGVLVVGTVVWSVAMDRASSGQQLWSPGAAFRAPVGDAVTVTRHPWRPGEDTIRVDVLVRRIADQRWPGKHAPIDGPPAVDECHGNEHTGPLFTYPYPLLRLASYEAAVMTVDGDVQGPQLHLSPIWRLVVVGGAFGAIALLPLLSKLIGRWIDSHPATILPARFRLFRLRRRPTVDPTEDVL